MSTLREKLLKIRFLLFPAGSRRERYYHAIRVALLIWRASGPKALAAKMIAKVKTRWLGDNVPTGSQLDAGWLYQQWIHSHEPNSWQMNIQRTQQKAFSYRPLVSILTPVYNPEPSVLEDTIRSVLAQTYACWELCLVNGGSNLPGVSEMLDRYARKDRRIKVKHLPKNLGISANTNEALAMAQGEFLALLDHDDLLAPDMLFEIVQQLNQDGNLDIVYYDEDKISADGKQRRDPWFKPRAWSPDLMLSTNYMMHSVIRKSLVAQIGGFNSAVDGAQDWDMMLRLCETNPRVLHIPRIFYHWRQVPGSAASNANAKPWAYEAQKRCIEAHLERQGVQGARVDFPSLGLVHIRWPISGEKVSIIIPTKDKVHLLRACLSSIFEKTTHPNYEIVLVDTGSAEPETLAFYAELKENERVHFVKFTGDFNFHVVNNLGAKQASGNIFVFLNNDTEVLNPEWLEELVGWAERDEVGIVGAKLLRPDGTIQHAGLIIGLAGHGSHVFEGGREHLYGPFGSSEWYRDFQAVTGACLAVRRDVFEQLSGFDELYQVGYGDIDFCLRAVDAGYRLVYNPFARLLHHEGGTRGFSQPASDVLRATARMLDRIRAGDPFFSENLSIYYRLPEIVHPKEASIDSLLYKILRDFDLVSEMIGEDLSSLSIIRNAGIGEVQKRILIITHELSLSGAPIMLANIAKSLKDQGKDVIVLSPADGPLHEFCDQAGIPVHLYANLLEDVRIVLRYLPGAEMVIVNTILGYRMVHAAKAFCVPCLWWIHESSFGQKMAQDRPAAAQAFNLANKVLFPAMATQSLYTSFSQRKNYHMIHNGLDVQKRQLQTGTPPFERIPGILYMACIASIDPRKGQDILIQAIRALPGEVSARIKCFLIGKPLFISEPEYCKQVYHIAEGNAQIQILGEMPAEAVSRYLQMVDVFVLPSRDEALPLSLIEAMAFGKPIIATRVGGIPEIIKDQMNGVLVEKEDYLALARSIERFYLEKEFGLRLGKEAHQYYQDQLTSGKFSEKFLGLVSQLIYND